MNILHISHGIYEHRGVETFLKSLTNGLKEKCNQYIAVPRGRYKDIGFGFDGVFEIDKLNQLVDIVEENNIDIIQIHWTGEENFFKDDLIKLNDVVFVVGGNDSPESNMYCYVNIFSLWNPYIWEDNKKLPNPKRPKIIITTHTCSKLPLYLSKPCIDAIVHVSNKVKDINQNINTEHRVIYPGVDHRVFFRDKKLNDGIFTIGFSGSMSKYDAEIFNLILEHPLCKNWQFYFFGDGNYPNMPENIKFFGKVNNVQYYLNLCDAVLYATTQDSFSISCIEKMMCELPIVTNDIVKETVGNHAFIYKTPKEVMDYLERLYLDKKLRNDMGKAGREFAIERYSLNSFINAYDELYNSLLGLY